MSDRWKIRSRDDSITFPKVFSFIDNPEETLEAIEQLVRLGTDQTVSRIGLDQSGCELVDLGAEAVATVLGRELHRRMGKSFFGTFPADQEQREIVETVGLPHELGVTDFEHPNFLCLPMTRGTRSASPEENETRSEEATKRLVDHFDECLQQHGKTLSDAARFMLSEMVGEVITNAEEHSDHPSWWVSAYYRRSPDEDHGDCHIVIFNLGRSVSDSLKTLPPSARLRREILTLIARHRGRKLFVRGPVKWQPEDLWTLYALQKKVSRRNTGADKVGDYGQGTARLIREFQELSGHRIGDPRMVFLSGATHILFDGTYKLERTGESAGTIAFNEANSLAERPDPRYVRHLTRRFPGTLISLRFFLDREHLDELETARDGRIGPVRR